MLNSHFPCLGNWDTWLPPSNMAAPLCLLLHQVENIGTNCASLLKHAASTLIRALVDCGGKSPRPRHVIKNKKQQKKKTAEHQERVVCILGSSQISKTRRRKQQFFVFENLLWFCRTIFNSCRKTWGEQVLLICL